MKWIVLLFVLACVNLQATGQNIPEISENELPAYSINRNETYDGPSLWGYMNGGADIYLEYGFEVLRVQEFEKNDENLKLELFKMDDPLSAFGIYSIKIFKCRERPLFSAMDCLNPYQYQLLHGRYYIQIINESGSEKAKAMMSEIAGAILKKLKAEELALPATYLMDSLKLSPAGIKMLKGPLGIQNKAMELEGYFDGLDDYRIFYSKTEYNGKKQKYYEIVFDDHEMKDRFLKEGTGETFQIIQVDGSRVVCKR